MEKLNTSSNASSTSWLSHFLFEENEIEGCDFFQQCEQNLFGKEEFTSHDIASVFQQEENLQQQPSLLFENSSSCPLETNLERLNKKLNTNTTLHEVVPSSQTQLPQDQKGSLKGQGTKRSVADDHQDRIMAERKRREKLSQCLITLAALIPGLTKMDKASVIGDAIKHVKDLQERLRVLEEQNKNNPIEFVVKLNKPQPSYELWSDDGFKAASANNETLPHVEAKILGKDVIIRIQCEKQKTFLLNILVEIQKLHLFVVNSGVLAIGDSIRDITIIAQMDKASVIEDAIKHVKDLQERSRVSEEKNKNSHIESVGTINKPQLSYQSWSDDGSKAASANNEALPHIDANVLDKNVLIRIQCQRQKSFLLDILVEVQKLHLFVVNSRVLPFGDSIVDVTIVAQMGTGYNFTKTDLVKSIRAAVLWMQIIVVI